MNRFRLLSKLSGVDLVIASSGDGYGSGGYLSGDGDGDGFGEYGDGFGSGTGYSLAPTGSGRGDGYLINAGSCGSYSDGLF